MSSYIEPKEQLEEEFTALHQVMPDSKECLIDPGIHTEKEMLLCVGGTQQGKRDTYLWYTSMDVKLYTDISPDFCDELIVTTKSGKPFAESRYPNVPVMYSECFSDVLVGPKKLRIRFNLTGLMNANAIILAFSGPEDYEEWKSSTEADYISYLKPWLKDIPIFIFVAQEDIDKQRARWRKKDASLHLEMSPPYGTSPILHTTLTYRWVGTSTRLGSKDFMRREEYYEVDPFFEGLDVRDWSDVITMYQKQKITSYVDSYEFSQFFLLNLDEITLVLFGKSRTYSNHAYVDSMTPVPVEDESGNPTPLLVGQTLITQKLYEDVMGTNPSRFKGCTQLPVDQVSWFDLLRFCNRLSELQGFRPCYYNIGNGEEGSAEWDRTANGYRLLTEREWEYIARANRTFTYSGSDAPNEVAWYAENSKYKTHPVGLKKGNSFGTYDQSGNLSEWCWDKSAEDDTDRVLRGGNSNTNASHMRAAYRRNDSYARASDQYNGVGGRLARSPDP
jgi:sulfatase modifying factor 1